MFMKREQPALYVIIAIALLVSVCGCLTQQEVNDTEHSAQAPTSGEPISAPVLTTGNSFACINATPARTTSGVVTKIVDGDTVHVRIDDVDYTVRYIGINAPEDTVKNEWMSSEATTRNKELVAGKNVILVKDVRETDRYGRLLRFVFVGDILVNYELVREGYAQATPYPPDISCKQTFYEAQLLAMQEHRGLWSAGAAS
jgi:endonuclease YncB( thermonuclease family)